MDDDSQKELQGIIHMNECYFFMKHKNFINNNIKIKIKTMKTLVNKTCAFTAPDAQMRTVHKSVSGRERERGGGVRNNNNNKDQKNK